MISKLLNLFIIPKVWLVFIRSTSILKSKYVFWVEVHKIEIYIINRAPRKLVAKTLGKIWTRINLVYENYPFSTSPARLATVLLDMPNAL